MPSSWTVWWPRSAVPCHHSRSISVCRRVVPHDQSGASRDGFRDELAVIDADAGRVTRRAGRWVEDEVAGVDADGRPSGGAQRRGGLAVEQIWPVGGAEAAAEGLWVDGHDVDVPRAAGGPVAVPAGVDRVRGLTRRDQGGTGQVGCRVVREASDPYSVPQGAGNHVDGPRLGHCLHSGAETLAAQSICGRVGTPPVRDHAGWGVRIGAPGRRCDEDLERPHQRWVTRPPGDLGERHTRGQRRRHPGLREVGRPQVEGPAPRRPAMSLGGGRPQKTRGQGQSHCGADSGIVGRADARVVRTENVVAWFTDLDATSARRTWREDADP